MLGPSSSSILFNCTAAIIGIFFFLCNDLKSFEMFTYCSLGVFALFSSSNNENWSTHSICNPYSSIFASNLLTVTEPLKSSGVMRTYEICKSVLDDIITVPEGAVCTTIINMYNKNAIVVEPAGALSVAALRFYADKIRGKNIACIISGSNNDIIRMEEIREKSLLYEGLKHYFIVNFPQKSGVILSFVRDILGPEADLVHFQYIKKTNKDFGPALVGIEVTDKAYIEDITRRMNEQNFSYEYINENNKLFEILI